MLKSLISKLVGISSAVAITGSLAAGPANATVYGPVGSPYLNTCRVTGPRISTITSEAGLGFGDLAIHGTCFPTGYYQTVRFYTAGPGPVWIYDAIVFPASDGTFTTPMVPRTVARTAAVTASCAERVSTPHGGSTVRSAR